jgi:hypothetical protein
MRDARNPPTACRKARYPSDTASALPWSKLKRDLSIPNACHEKIVSFACRPSTWLQNCLGQGHNCNSGLRGPSTIKIGLGEAGRRVDPGQGLRHRIDLVVVSWHRKRGTLFNKVPEPMAALLDSAPGGAMVDDPWSFQPGSVEPENACIELRSVALGYLLLKYPHESLLAFGQ